MTASSVRIGDRVKDKITGITGIVIGYHYWLYGCERVTIQPEEAKDGKPAESFCIDAAQVTIIKAAVIAGYVPPDGMVDSRVINRPAGPRPEAARGHSTTR